MIEWVQPLWLWALVPVAAWSLWAVRRVQAERPRVRLAHPALPPTDAIAAPGLGLRLPAALRGLAFALFVLALAQPRQLGDWITPPPEGRDLVLLIDTSLTMSIRDFRQGDREVERIVVLKDTLARFIAGRDGDRVGVIVFGSEGATLTPPTFDRAHAAAQIRRLQVGMAGPDTALGDALGMALKQVRAGPLRPAVILVSDGADTNAGLLTPAEALAAASRLGVAIHTLQFGSDPYASGRSPRNESDEQPDLAALSRLTGGQHFAIAGADDAERVIRAIDRLEPTLARPAKYREVREAYAALIALGALALVAARRLTLRAQA